MESQPPARVWNAFPRRNFQFVTGASSKTWIPELIAAADSKVTETYIDFFTSAIRNRNARAAYARGLAGSFLTGAPAHGLTLTEVERIRL
jgi:hypothetical protein